MPPGGMPLGGRGIAELRVSGLAVKRRQESFGLFCDRRPGVPVFATLARQPLEFEADVPGGLVVAHAEPRKPVLDLGQAVCDLELSA